MEQRPLVSVIAPVYKVEEYLPKMIDSVLAQTFKDFEFLLVDDGSPDHCGEICDAAARKDERIKVIHKKNGGAADARNVAMEIAEGKYFHFVDSDDWIEPNLLQILVDAAEKYNAMLVITGFCMEYYEDGKFSSYDVSPEAAVYLTKDAFRLNAHKYLNQSFLSLPFSKLYLADTIKKKKLQFPKTMWDDTHFNMDFLMDVESVVFVPGSPYHYFRSRPGSETSVVFDVDKLYNKRKEHFDHICRLYKHWEIQDRQSLVSIYTYYIERILQCIQEIAINPKLSAIEKKKKISEILKDEQTKKGAKIAKPDSFIMNVAVFPIRTGSVFLCYMEGKVIGFLKTHKANLFYKIRSKIVHKAKKRVS